MRIRTIKPEFWESEHLGNVSRDARLLFVGLFSCCDDSGRTRAGSRLLASRLFPYDEDAFELLPGWLAELEAKGCIRVYEVEGETYLDIPKWLSHQKIDKPTASKLPEFREDSRGFAKNSLGLGKGMGTGNGNTSSCPASASPPPDELPLDSHANPEADAAVDWFIALLTETGSKPPKLSPSARRGWADAFDKLIRFDGHTLDRVKAVCRWARNDPFWRQNFMAPPKLREKKHGVSYMDHFANKINQTSFSTPVRLAT